MARLFNKDQKREHAQEIGGWHSEFLDENGNPYCGGRIESHHLTGYAQGGETEMENIFFADKVSHAVIHLLQDEVNAFNLIRARMNAEELEELHRRGH